MATTAQTDIQLRSVLDRLEQCLETPILPGKMTEWLDSCRQHWADVELALQQRFDQGHAELLKEIATQDPELLPRVEKLIAEDTELLKTVRRLRGDAERLATHNHRAAPDNNNAEAPIEAFTKEAVEFVLRVRNQETAIVTWYQEAFNRDRGTQD